MVRGVLIASLLMLCAGVAAAREDEEFNVYCSGNYITILRPGYEAYADRGACLIRDFLADKAAVEAWARRNYPYLQCSCRTRSGRPTTLR